MSTRASERSRTSILRNWLFSSIALAAASLGSSAGCSKSKAAPNPPPEAKAELKASSPASGQSPTPSAGAPLTVAYSDWPGWVAWDIGVAKGWFKEAGVDVSFKWFEYAPSMDAFSAGKVDAVCVTNGDALVTSANGAKSVAILLNDFSDGNDMVIAKPGIKSISDLKGKKVGVEVGFVDHLLLMYALKSKNLGEKDVTLVNMPTDQAAQTLKAGDVSAVAAWQPNSGAALSLVPGSTPIFTSADVKGLIYDELVVNPKSLAEHRREWLAVVKVWDRIAQFVNNGENLNEAAKIMSARVGLDPEKYKALMKGTRFLDLKASLKHWEKGDGLESVYGSSRIVDEFNVKNKVYKAASKIEEHLDPSLTAEATR
ncbi:MAG TPA: ABC transporter substrate-binding protein [Polyangiaceae bacterium]|nr:ABC transporter substrate-binding protein [Polyangiaceae bacterium]